MTPWGGDAQGRPQARTQAAPWCAWGEAGRLRAAWALSPWCVTPPAGAWPGPTAPQPEECSGALAPRNQASGERSRGQRAPSCTGHASGTTSAAAPADGPEPPSPLCRASVEDAGGALAQACLRHSSGDPAACTQSELLRPSVLAPHMVPGQLRQAERSQMLMCLTRPAQSPPWALRDAGLSSPIGPGHLCTTTVCAFWLPECL